MRDKDGTVTWSLSLSLKNSPPQMNEAEQKTIAAISSGLAPSAIGIIRLSGPASWLIAKKLCCLDSAPQPGHIWHGPLYLNTLAKQILDDVILIFFKAPHSYTGEDLVEIHCHGSLAIMRAILEMCLNAGATLAAAGEFSKKAFVNGKLDLGQAEAIQGLIAAESAQAAILAANGLQGRISSQLEELRKQLLRLLTHLNASLDFPEEVELLPAQKIKEDLADLWQQATAMAQAAKRGQLFRQGLLVPIVGKPNVGKSTLLNAWLGEERAITSTIAGTTRDWLEGLVTLEGVPLRLIDTAGWRQTRDPVEAEGVIKAEQFIQQADVLIFMLDNSRPWEQADALLWQQCQGKPRVVVLNKTDLVPQIQLPEALKDEALLAISATKDDQLKIIQAALWQHITAGQTVSVNNSLYLSERQLEKLNNTLRHLDQASTAVARELTLDCLSADLKLAAQELGEITGEAVSAEVIEHIFAEFCVGK